jgi:predicted RNA-binding protein YlxR (DUF448 family)
VACRQVKNKKELVRLVATAAGDLEIDRDGRKPGRGVYICPTRPCWDKARQGNRLEHSLRRSLNRATIERLAGQFNDIIEGVS